MPLALAVFLIALSGLMFEVALTRIFSATIWYHFAFVAISVALLGWGLGGFALHLLRRRLAFSLDGAAALTLAYAGSIPASLLLIVSYPFHPERLSFYFLASLVPFLLAGMALAMVFATHQSRAGRLYLFDLLGASLGAVIVTLLLGWLGAERSVVAVAAAPALAAALLSRKWRPAAAVVLGLVVLALVRDGGSGPFRIRAAPTKGMYRHLAASPGARVVRTGWNAYSRIDAVAGLDSLARLYIDADAWTNLHRWDGRVESLRHLADWYRALPFRLVSQPRTLVIGPGGGSDVLVALGAGSRTVTAVEMNPLMLRFVRSFGGEAGDLYDHPRVETVLSEGRNFLSRTDRRWDVIFLGFVDSWASVASGGLSLAENYLYTAEAFRAYLDHLTDDGILVILRWDVDIPRLVSNSVAVLGLEAAAARVVSVLERRSTPEDPAQMIFMLRKRPFLPAETAMIMDGAAALRPVIVPGRHLDPPYDAVFARRVSFSEWVERSPVRVDPVFDDKPFYFAGQKPFGIPRTMGRALVLVLMPVLALCAALVAGGRPRGAQTRAYAGSVGYFACLGLGFMAVELTLLQRLTLLLGHPIFTLSVLLFALLAAGGLGSALSHRFSSRLACLAVAALGAAGAFALPPLVEALLPLPLPGRLAVAVAIVVPLGLAMGMPFPSGLRRVGSGSFPAPPFYWGLNGVMSVVGSVGTMLLAVAAGFRAAMLAGALLYLAAGFLAGILEPESAP
jgi:predicted membrane-bound spermidine synthase